MQLSHEVDFLEGLPSIDICPKLVISSSMFMLIAMSSVVEDSGFSTVLLEFSSSFWQEAKPAISNAESRNFGVFMCVSLSSRDAILLQIIV